jgi:hypothetical protein
MFAVQERIFKEFYSFTFPSEYMSYQAFAEAMDNKLLPAEKAKLSAYFRAFDAQQKSYLTYSDYLLGTFENNSRLSMTISLQDWQQWIQAHLMEVNMNAARRDHIVRSGRSRSTGRTTLSIHLSILQYQEQWQYVDRRVSVRSSIPIRS